MKKVITFVITFACIALCLTGCAAKEAEPAPTETVASETVVTKPIEIPTEAPTEAPTEPEPERQVYPLNPGMAYYNYAVELPDHIYTTLGSENGLEGTIYAFDGTVVETDVLNAGGFSYDCATVETDGGNVYILNMYKAVCQKGGKAIYSDNEDYYVYPQIGEPASFLVVYMGFSEVKGLPAFILGASADVLDMGSYADPVADQLQELIK